MKKITMGPKPTSAPASADAWVAGSDNTGLEKSGATVQAEAQAEAVPEAGVGQDRVGRPEMALRASSGVQSDSGAAGGLESGGGERETPSPPNAESPATPATSMKRLTIDIPEDLHARIKSQCAMRRTKMVDEIRTLLETHFAADT